jgi:hypothetical protein
MWQELSRHASLNLEQLNWLALIGQERALDEIGLVAFDYGEWLDLNESVKKQVRPLLTVCFKLVEIQPSDYESWCQEFSDVDERTFFLNSNLGSDFWKPGLMAFLKAQELQQSKDLIEVATGLNELVAHSLQELQRVKKIHETLVPLRIEKVKGLSIMSKFAAGEASGGEFYDVIQGEEEFCIVLTHSSSYMASSLILSAFEEFRKNKSFELDVIQEFSLRLANTIKHEAGPKSLEGLQLFLARVDMKSLVIEGVNWGRSQLVSSGNFFVSENDFPIDSSFIDKSTFQNKLARSESYVLLSPGLRANCSEIIEGERLISYVRRMMHDGPKKTLQEVFYHLKKGRESSFLKYDATSVFIEVDPNVIVQI